MASEIDPKAAEELAKNIQSVKNASLETTRAFQEQLKIITQMRDAMSQVAGNVRAMCQGECGVLSPETWDEATKAVEKHNVEVSEAASAAKKLAEVMKSSLAKAILVATTALTGLTQGFKNVIAMSKAAGKAISSIGGGIFSIAQSILSIPFKIFEKLFDMANQGGGGNELAAAYQEVVKTFGDIKSGMGKAVVDTAKGLDAVNKTGIRTNMIFGTMAERVKAAREMAEGLGPAFSVFEEEVDKGGSAMLIFNRALGISNEQMAGIATNAMRMGKSINDVHMSMTKQALGMEKAFKLNAKTLSKDMAKAMQDLSHFGHLSTKEMAVTAAFAQKMGVSIDKLVGVMDSTKTFDQTAEGMSKLNEQFNTNIDFTEIMSAQSPEEKVAILSKEFARAGTDLKHLTVQQRDLIKTSSGLTDEVLNSMAAHGDMTDTLKGLNKQADKNEDKVMSQTEAMKELAKQIDKLTPSGGENKKTIFEQIIEGMTRGIKASPEFLQLMKNIRDVFRLSLQFGFELGRQIMKLVPAFGTVLTGFKELFDPQRFRKMFGGVLDAFKILEKGGPDASKKFFEKMTATFKEFFSAGENPGKKIIGGFADIGKTLVKVIAGLGTFVMEGLAKLMPKITEYVLKFLSWIKNPKELGIGKIKADAPEWLRPLIEMFGTFKTVLLPALKDAFDKIWPELKPLLVKATPYVLDALKAMLFAAFAPAMLSSITGAASAFLGKSLFQGILHATGNAGDKEVGVFAKKISGFLEKGFEGARGFMGTNAGKLFSKAALPLAVAAAAIDVSDSIKKYSGQLQEKGFDPATAKIASGAAGLINALTLGLFPESLQGKLAEGIAWISKKLFESLDKLLGPSFSAAIKKHLEGAFDIFGGIGDLLKAMWNGDSKGVMDALGTIGMGMIKSLLGILDLVANTVLKLGPLVFEYLMKALEMVSSKIGDIFLSLKEIYIIGPIAELIGEVFKFLANIFNASGQGWKLIGEFFKNIWISFEDLPGKIAVWGEAIIEGITSPFKKGWQKIKDIFGEGVNKVKDFLGINSPSKLFQDIGKNMADGVDQSLQKVPENAQKTFEKTAEVAKSATAQATTGTGGPAASMNPQDVEVAAKLISMITDLIKAIGGAIGGAPATGEVNPASVQAITAAVPTIMSLIDGIKTKAGPLVSGITDVIKSIPNDPAFKEKLKFAGEFFDFIGKLTRITSLLDVPNQVPGQGPVNSVLLNLDWINTMVYGMTHNWMAKEKGANSIKNIVDNLKEIFSLMPAGIEKEVPKVTNLLSGVSALIGAFADPFKGVSLQENQSAVNSVLIKLNEVDTLMWGMTHNWMADGKNSIQGIVNNAKLIAGAVSATAKRDAVGSINTSLKTVEEIVAATQKMDNALSNLPKINLQARLTEVAGIAGLGAKGIYTVNSKDVVINVEFNISMDVDKVEKVLITRQQSVIRDRINFIMDNTMRGNNSTENAMIKRQGEQSGNVSTKQP